MKKTVLGEDGFLAAEAALLALLLFFAALSLAAVERSAHLLAQSEAETSAMFLAEGELARAEQLAGRASLNAPLLREVEENGREFSLKTEFLEEKEDYASVCLARVHVVWIEEGKEREFFLQRTVRRHG